MRPRRIPRSVHRTAFERLESRWACSATAAAPPAATLGESWDGRAGFVLDPARGIATSSGRQFTHASMLADGGLIRGYTTEWLPDGDADWGNDRFGVRLFTTTDGDTWTDEGMVLTPRPGLWCDQMASFPGVTKVGPNYYMVFEGKKFNRMADIGLATSADGVHWTVDPAPLLTHTGRGYERVNIGTPSLHHENGTWTLFYHAYDGRDCRVFAATGSDLRSLSRVNDGRPILDTSRAGIDSGTIGKRSRVIREGDFYYMAVEVSSDQVRGRGFGGSDWSTILVRSPSLTGGWERMPGTLLRTTGTGFGFDGPELIFVAGQWRLYTRDKAAFTRFASLVFANPLTFEAERDLKHEIGRAEADGWAVRPGDPRGRLAVHGPFTSAVASGPRTATFRLLSDTVGGRNRGLAAIDVRDAATGRVLARRRIDRGEFAQPLQYQDFTLGFSAGAGQRLEFRLKYRGGGSCRLDSIVVQ